MLQIHPNARTTPATRAEIARSSEPSGVLARRYGVSAETIRKYENLLNRRFLPWCASKTGQSGSRAKAWDRNRSTGVS